MSAENIANDIAAKQGWTDTTLLDLCLAYIDNQGSNDAFEGYLHGIAAEESQPDTDEDHEATAVLGSGDPDYDEAVAQESEADRLHLLAQVGAILARKRGGMDVADEESAIIKAYLRPRQEMADDSTSYVSQIIAVFPNEWDELGID